MNTNTQSYEQRSLSLTRAFLSELRHALDSVGGRVSESLAENYIFYTSIYVKTAIESYILLRENGLLEASKMLVRTAIESVIRIHAIRKHAEFVFQVAYTEYQEDIKWTKALDLPQSDILIAKLKTEWEDFRESYKSRNPDHECTEKTLNLRDTAHIAEIGAYYDSHYRLYCRFTHAAFRASAGDLAEFEQHDNYTMSLCAMVTIEAMTTVGATAPNLDALKNRFVAEREDA